MIQPYATRPEPPVSLPIRLEKKRKRTKTATIALVAGSALLAGGTYNFTIRGSELIAIWLTVLAVGALSLGITLLVRASRIRDH